MTLLGTWPEMASTGEALLFACTSLVMIACALGVLFFTKAAYSAICMVGVMLGLAVLYIAQSAPFLGVVQVVVYTGAIMMLFLFVIMMIGIGASDDYATQSRGTIVAAIFGGCGLIVILVGAVGHTLFSGVPTPTNGITPIAPAAVDPYSDEPVTALAETLFGEHWLTMEVSGALLITAAIGAMFLTHTDRLGPKVTQEETAKAKMRAFAESGRRIGQLPAPGVYAHSNAADVPAISGETLAPVADSVPRVIRVRGLERSLDQVDHDVAQSLVHARSGDVIDSPFAHEASAAVPRSGSWGMPGPAAPTGLDQPLAPAPSTVEAEDRATVQEEEK